MKPETYQLMRQIEDKHWWFVARRSILSKLLSTLEFTARIDILEIGCGTGGNIASLKQFGEVTCVESDSAAAMLARERKLAPVLPGKLPYEMPDFNHQFDLVLLLDVIEHIEQDGESLQALTTSLKPGGHIVLTVPAFSFLWSQHDDENHHRRRYNRKTLANVINNSGLCVDYMSYFNFWLFPLVASVRLFRKVFPYTESWQDMKQPTGVLNQILQFIFSSERFFIGKRHLPFGLSLVAVVSVQDSNEFSTENL